MRLTTRLTTAAALCGSSLATAGGIDQALENVLQDAAPDETVPVMLYLYEQVDLDTLRREHDARDATLTRRHAEVVRELQATAGATRGALATHLDDLAGRRLVDEVRDLWIVNAFKVVATPNVIRALARHPDVRTAYYDFTITSIAPVAPDGANGPAGAVATAEPEVGLVAIRAPEVWAIGITGEGALVSTLDTGVDGNHPALASRWAGVADPRYEDHPEWAWFDPVTNTTFPQAWDGHGTHTMGSLCGGAPGDEVGVAPGATWIHAGVINREGVSQTIADAILAFQWSIDPDGNPDTNWDVPITSSNSWGIADFHGWEDCNDTFWQFLDACEAAGIAVIFSAGSEGSSGLRRPADRATDEYRTMAVAFVDAGNPAWPIAASSSRGPTFCTPDGGPAIKPDISGPGINVRSAWPGGGYAFLSGSSMAPPHINGVMALMHEANPDLTPQEKMRIIYDTAVDLGPSGEDNAYGYGMVDAFEAVRAALDMKEDIPGDADADGDVDFDDVLLILSKWGPVDDCPPAIPEDADEDCDVGFADLLIALSNWTG